MTEAPQRLVLWSGAYSWCRRGRITSVETGPRKLFFPAYAATQGLFPQIPLA